MSKLTSSLIQEVAAMNLGPLHELLSRLAVMSPEFSQLSGRLEVFTQGVKQLATLEGGLQPSPVTLGQLQANGLAPAFLPIPEQVAKERAALQQPSAEREAAEAAAFKRHRESLKNN